MRRKLAAAVGVTAAAIIPVFSAAPANAGYYVHPKCVTAQTMNYYVDSTSSQVRHNVSGKHQVYAAQEANGRYHVSLFDTTGTYNGWMTTDSRWHYAGYC